MRSLLLWLLLASQAWAVTAEELVARNLQARGGLDKIKALTSLRLVGRFRYAGGDSTLELGYTALFKRGLKYRSEASLQGLTAVSAFDGHEAWQLQPFGGRRDPERLSADQARIMAYQADLEGELVDWSAKGYQIDYLGTEDVDGTTAHKLRVTLKGGDLEYVYLDPDYFLEIRILRQTHVRGVEQVEETDLSNYEKVAGVYLPFSIESGPRGGEKSSQISIEKAEANPPLEDSLFAFPSGGSR